MSEARRYALLVFAGILLAQAAWILALPPFRASDEFDHVYRAAGIVQGDWILDEQLANGRGLAVTVPEDLVLAAEMQCEALPYTKFANCHGVEDVGDGNVRVATAAGAYNPLYYAVVGYAAAPFDGAGADYAMRIVSAMISAVAISLAAFCLGVARAGPWTRFGFVVSLTPVLLYTSVVPAPNSVEIVSALVVWCALLALFSGGVPARLERRLVHLAGLAAVVTVVPRQLGPLWLALIAGLLLVFAGGGRVREVVSRHRGPAVAYVLLVVTGTCATVAWSMVSGFYGPSPDAPESPIAFELAWLVVWPLQIVGAFPFRDQAAPMGVYLIYAVTLVVFVGVALRRARRRHRWAVLAGIALVMVVPVALTLATSESQGVVWQGRYQLAVVVGIGVMIGLSLDAQVAHRLWSVAMVVGSALLAVSHGWSVVAVQHRELGREEVGIDPAWVTAHPVVLLALAVVGVGAMLAWPVAQCYAGSSRGLSSTSAPFERQESTR